MSVICKTLDCVDAPDFPDNSSPIPPLFLSRPVYYDITCGVGETAVYTGPQTPWIQLVGNQLVGHAGAFSGVTQAAANATAQAALDAFAANAIALGQLGCETAQVDAASAADATDGAPAAPTDMVIWVDASILTEADGVAISPWLDLSGNANNLVVTAGSLVVKTNIQNGLRGVLLGAGAGATSSGPTFAVGGPMTLIGVWKHQVGPGITRAVNMLTGNLGIGTNSDTQLRCVWVNGVTTNLTQLITAASTARVQTFISPNSGASTAQWIVQGGGAVTTGNEMPGGRIGIGRTATTAENMLGHWFELRVWDRILTASEITATVNLLTSKWDLTADPTPTPAAPTSVANCEVWIDSSVLPGADGSTVSAWDDLSGNSNNFGGVNGTPTLRYNSQNGLKGVEFAAGAGLTGTYARAAGAFTVILVWKSNSASGTFRRALQGSSNWLIGPYLNVVNVYNGHFMTGNGSDLVAHVLVVTQVAGTSVLYMDRAKLYTHNVGTAWPGTINLGRNGSSNEPLLGLIYEVAIYSRVLTDTEILDVTDALRTKWDTP